MNETEGVVFVEVGLIGEAQLLREVSVLLSFSDGSATSKNIICVNELHQIKEFFERL